MSDNIPFEIQAEIIKRVVPVKSLIRFRSVSKQWKSLIDSSQFFTDHHSLNQAQPRHLLITYAEDYKDKYVSIADDHTFPYHKFSPIVPPPAKLLEHPSIINCSHGLVCLYGYAQHLRNRNKLIVLWNPSIRKFVGIPIPYGFDVVGCGVSPKTSDPKIVTLTRANGRSWKAELFTLSSGVWRSISVNPRWSRNQFSNNQVVIDGAIHWIAFELIAISHHRIFSFGLTSEEFGEVDLPDSLAHSSNLSISELNGSLAVLNHNEGTLVCEVWMMTNNGDPKSRFTKLYTVSLNRTVDTFLHVIIGFRKNGQPITEHICRTGPTGGLVVTTLEVYDSSSEHSNDLGMDVAYNSVFKMTSYTESLLLLNHSDSIVQ